MVKVHDQRVYFDEQTWIYGFIERVLRRFVCGKAISQKIKFISF